MTTQRADDPGRVTGSTIGMIGCSFCAGSGGLLDSLKKALAERALNAEMDYHLGGDEQVGNSRNGYGRKRVITDSSKIEIEVPRDREGSFDPQLIAKYQRRFPGFDEKIISMYARGMSTREITGHLRALYGIDVSPDLISTVTDGEHRAVPGAREDAQRWKKLPPGSSVRSIRPIRWCFSTPFASRSAMKAWSAVEQASDGPAVNPIHIALGVRADGRKEVLGLWIEQNEGAKFWLRVMNEL